MNPRSFFLPDLSMIGLTSDSELYGGKEGAKVFKKCTFFFLLETSGGRDHGRAMAGPWHGNGLAIDGHGMAIDGHGMAMAWPSMAIDWHGHGMVIDGHGWHGMA